MDSLTLLGIDFLVGILGFIAMLYLVPVFAAMFDDANLVRLDVIKPGDKQIPDALGVIAGLVFVVCMVCLTPFLFLEADLVRSFNALVSHEYFQWLPQLKHNREKCFCYYRKELIPYFATLFCISLMTLFGFVDDVLTLKRKRKFFIPAIASLPIVMYYFTSFGNTTMVVPSSFKWIFGEYINFGPFYYLYIMGLPSFCANSIELLSDLDGLSVGQCIIINISIILHNMIEMNGPEGIYHRFSLYFMIPFLFISSGLFHYNRYPSRVFVGDTYAYTAGMVFSVIAILGHFSEMLILFFLPQLFNLIYSLPQILRYLPYPRRRSPKLNSKTGKLVYSKARIKKISLDPKNKAIMKFLQRHKLLKVEEYNESSLTREFNNLTIENLILVRKGPMSERMLTRSVMFIQILNCFCVLFVRYGLLYAVFRI